MGTLSGCGWVINNEDSVGYQCFNASEIGVC